MAGWREVIARLGFHADSYLDTLKERLSNRLRSRDPVQVLVYQGHGTAATLYISGRVLENRDILSATDSDTVWQNLVAMYQRFYTQELPDMRVEARFRDAAQTTVTDDEGYFAFELKLAEPLNEETSWHTVQVALLDEGIAGQTPIRTEGTVLVPPPQSDFGVISDIDDTIVQTYATHVLKMARVVFLGNARTRLPFAGVAAFYQALQRGVTSVAQNPFFYVSSSPWNLYDLLVDFMNIQGIPHGPVFLRDYDLERKRLLQFGHQEYKLARIRHLLDTYPDLPFLLIGDSGQEDPEIYRQAVKEYPGRILAIYIRDVSRNRRDAQVYALAQAAQAERVEMLLMADTVAAAEHAATQGWIDSQALDSIKADKRRDQQAPTELEQLLEAA